MIDTSLDNLSPPELIAQYVLECRGAGALLPYDDYSIIHEWISAMPNTNQLLLILADTLPDYFAGSMGRTPRSLKAVKKRILQKIMTAQKREA